jgi:hypothetical protein
MKSQARPFTVEVKSKRRPLQASHTNWSTAIDEPTPEDVPSRDVREDTPDTPLAAASRVFSAFATSAMSSASTLGGLAASVFTRKPQEQPAEQPAKDDTRTGRILPSLLPVNRFEVGSGEEDGPVQKPAKPKRPRKRAVAIAVQQEAPEPTELAADATTPKGIPSELSPAATPLPRHARKRDRPGTNARVRAGEGWKRRRLPKACW